ncbi:MAG: amidohydrolase family protein [Planctomycetota bacterium]|nr:amidohydrolase family protein [Planctomycetota bacterium]
MTTINPLFSRRQLLKNAAAGALLAGVSGLPFSGRVEVLGDDKPDDAKKEYPPGRYVDIHTHLGRTWNTTEILTAKDLLKWMDENDIAQSVVLPLVSPESSSYPLTPDFVLEETKDHRDRLIPFCCIDPRTSFQGGKEGLAGMLKDYRDRGCKGFGEHKTGIAMDDPRNLLVYETCGEVGLPVLFHTDTIRNVDAPGLPILEKVLKKLPQTTFIAHANGWWASISGDVTEQAQLSSYPKGPVVPGGAIDRIMDECPNIYGDLSAGSGANAIMRDLEFGREFLLRRADRLLFGTDYLTPGQDVPQLTLYRQLELPDDVQAKIFRDNARKLLNI